jgi:hypothetical protein
MVRHRVWLVWLVGWLSVACAHAAPASAPTAPAAASGPSDDTLAARVTSRILQLMPSAKVERRSEHQLHVQANGEHDLYLDNLAQGCKNAPASCDERIDMFAHTVVSPPDAPATLEALLPTLKSQAYVDGAQKAMSARGQHEALLAFPVIDDLRLLLVMDTPVATRLLSEKDLASLGVTRDVARERALDNLRKHSPGFKIAEVGPQLYALSAGDAYDSAMFLLQPEWQHLIAKLGGAPVVAPIGRDIVLFTGVDSADGLKALSMILAAERREPAAAYPITTQPYRWTPEGWVRFELAPQ